MSPTESLPSPLFSDISHEFLVLPVGPPYTVCSFSALALSQSLFLLFHANNFLSLSLFLPSFHSFFLYFLKCILSVVSLHQFPCFSSVSSHAGCPVPFL